jgi:integrase
VADIRRKSDRAWLVRWRESGRQRYRQFHTEAEALAFKKTVEPAAADQMMAEAKRRGEFVDFSGEVDQWGRRLDAPRASEERWSVTAYARRLIDAGSDLSPASRHVYRRAIRLYVEPTDLGGADVRHVKPDQLDAWWAGIDSGRQDAQRLVSKVFRHAVRVGDRGDNPLERTSIRKPRKRGISFDPLTADQIETLADAATQTTKGLPGRLRDMTRQRDRLLILVMGFAGLRAGEVGGLRAQDLVRTSDGRCQFRIRQQVVRDDGVMRVGPLKTTGSERTITVACSLWDEVKAFVDEFGAAEDGRVFHGPNGEMRDHSLINGAVRAAAKRARMQGVHSHLLRHSAVSLLIDAGANPRAIQQFVGHADVSMTLGVYGHLFDQAGSELADVMERLREQHRNGR